VKTVLLTEPMHDAGIAILRAAPNIELVVGAGFSADAMAAVIARSHAIGLRNYPLPGALLARANGLQVVAKHGVGCDSIDVAHLTSRGIPVLVTASANKVSVAEHTMTLILALAKDIVAYDRAVRSDNWQHRYSLSAWELRGRTLLIIGFGRIGKEVAARARAFGMRVIVADIALDHGRAGALGCETTTDFRSALPQADIVSLHIPRNAATVGIFAAREFGLMKPGAIFVNCARGGLIDEAALIAALSSGHVSRAGLDVFDDEPLPASNPLRSRGDVLLSPHSAASTVESGRQMAVDTAENILAGLAGCPDPANVFNPEILGSSRE
jgi:D-3-phosphoglycerate dehydrogenase